MALLALLVLIAVIAGGASVAQVYAFPSQARSSSLSGTVTSTATPTLGPGAMTIYSVTNPYTTTLSIENVFTNTTGFNYTFWDQIPPKSTIIYHVSSISQIPSPFDGNVSLYSSRSFTAQIVGYDYSGSVTPTGSPTASPTVTPTPTISPTITSTPMVTGTPSSTPTVTGTPSSTPTVTGTPTASATVNPRNILFSDGFEENSFAAGGWTLDVVGSGATANLVTSPVWSGTWAASFSTQTQAQGQHAYADARFTWPASNIVSAQTMLEIQNASTVGVPNIFSLQTSDNTTRSGFLLSPAFTFGVIYTTRDGLPHLLDTGIPFQPGKWYALALTVDKRAPQLVFSFFVNDNAVYSVVDTSTGTSTSVPVAVVVGFGSLLLPTNTEAVVVADNVIVINGPHGPAH